MTSLPLGQQAGRAVSAVGEDDGGQGPACLRGMFFEVGLAKPQALCLFRRQGGARTAPTWDIRLGQGDHTKTMDTLGALSALENRG